MKFNRIFVALMLLASIFAAGKPAVADTVLYNSGAPVGGLWSNSNIRYYAIADAFTVDSASVADAFSFNVYVDSSGSLASFNWAITSAQPTTAVSSTSTNIDLAYATGVGTSGFTASKIGNINSSYLYTITVPLSQLALDPGTTYWLEISNASASNGSSGIEWQKSNSSNDTAIRAGFGTLGGDTEYTILGSVVSSPTSSGGGEELSVVPEPPSFTLLGLGLASLLITLMLKKSGTPADVLSPLA